LGVPGLPGPAAIPPPRQKKSRSSSDLRLPPYSGTVNCRRPKGFPELQGSFLYVIKQIELTLRPRFMEACAARGISGAKYTALTVLYRHPGITGSDLARRSFVRAQTMATTLDPLVERGFVVRAHDPEHGRRILLYLTPRGAQAISDLGPPIEALEGEMLEGLSETDRAAFADFLRKSANNLSGD
jgi:DNA-binding MarR family transcriptional regulator